ncbi:unnamed protein product [Phyllotreta striolata]|uniref:CRAL-TRIO domain-containing protein n=1 Tax=Phyllotreta striolata TaxID=444603 RepID=A0A9P0GYH3_PHYSR|nr:unnamed protein product [Phyllotreta striolata]
MEDKVNVLQINRKIQLNLALKKYQKSEEDLDECVSVMKNWIITEKCFPEFPDERVLINFLLMNKFDIQNTKQKLQMYYSIREILPEFFKNKHPDSAHMREVAEKMCYIPLPKLTDEGYRVAIVKFVDDNPRNFRVYDFFAHTYNVTEIRLHEDVTAGDILVYDLGNLKVGHFFKLTPVVLKKTSVILEKVYSNRVKQIHILNSPKYAATTISLTKQIMKPKMAARIHVHKRTKTISEHISLGILPRDYGGEEKSLAELNKLWLKKLAEYKGRFDALDSMNVADVRDNSERLTNDEILGFHGDFRKLDVD